jgi:hypothetical protein
VIRAYASRTGTKRNLDALRAAGWGLLISATGVHRSEGFADHMLDNGAWTAHQSGKPWDVGKFEQLLDVFGRTSAQTIAPDIVAGGVDSLALSISWLPRLLAIGRPVLVPVQDGMEPEQLRPVVGACVGLFVGGSTAWKWDTLHVWAKLSRESGCRIHVGRAGSARMVSRCVAAGAHSFDTSEPSRYAIKLPGLDNARRQLPLIGHT